MTVASDGGHSNDSGDNHSGRWWPHFFGGDGVQKLMNVPKVYVEDETPITPSGAPKTTGVQVRSKTGVREHKLTGVSWGKPISTTRVYNTERMPRN